MKNKHFAVLKTTSSNGNKAKTYCYLYDNAIYFVQIFLCKNEDIKESDVVIKRFKNVSLTINDIAFKPDSFMFFINEMISKKVFNCKSK